MNNLMLKLFVRMQVLINREDGQDMVEYGVIVAALVVGGFTVFAAYTGALTTAMTDLANAVTAIF